MKAITTINSNKKTSLFSLCFTLLLTACTNSEYKIVVPRGYIGEVSLIKSNVSSNILTLDSNGVGYITEETFDKLRYKPSVNDASGKDLLSNCVGYSPSAFWARGEVQTSQSKMKIHYLSFEIVPDSLIGKKQYYSTDLFKVVDTLKIK